MNIFQKIFRRGSEPAALPVGDSNVGGLLFGRLKKGGDPMRISAVNAAVNIISDSIAMLPVLVSDKRGKMGDDDLRDHAVVQFFEGNHCRTLIDKYQLMKRMMIDVLMSGNAVAYIERDKSDNLYALHYLKDCTITYKSSTQEVIYTCQGQNYSANQVIHLKRYSADGITGIGVLQQANEILDLARFTDRSASRYFEQGGNLQGVITKHGMMTPQQAQDYKRSWREAYGPDGSGVAVLSGDMDYKPVQQSAANSQMLESRQYNVYDIARFFQMPPVLLGAESGTVNIEELQNMLVWQTLSPWIALIERELSRKLLNKPAERYYRVNLDETYLLRGNIIAKSQWYQTMLSTGVMSPNEVRQELGYQRIEGLDDHVIPYTDVDQNKLNGKKKEDE